MSRSGCPHPTYMILNIDTRWIESLRDCEDDVKVRLYEAIFDYMQGIIPNIPPEFWLVFNTLKPFMDEELDKRNRLAERSRENGKKGGRKRKNLQNPAEPKKPTGFLAYLGTEGYTERCERLLKLDDWIKTRAPFIYNNYIPLTQKEFNALYPRWNINDICAVISDIENRKDLRKKYVSLYRTCLNWLKNGYTRTDND